MLRIKQLREERGISQRALALRIGANPKTVNFWEHGQSEPSANFIVALSDFFECSADYVLGREDEMGVVNVHKTLAPREAALLKKFSALSDDKQRQLITYADFLAEHGDRII